jgi:hypothetical protein
MMCEKTKLVNAMNVASRLAIISFTADLAIQVMLTAIRVARLRY